MVPHIKKVTFDRRSAYKKASDTRNDTTYSDANPITRNFAPLPWAPAYNAIASAIKPFLSKNSPAPGVPLAAWQNHALYNQPWAHLFINSAFPYRLCKTNDWTVTAPTLVTAFIYEFYLVEDYRRAVLKGPGGELRHILVEVLPEDLTDAITHTFEDGQKSILWWDALRYPRIARQSDGYYIKRGVITHLDKSMSDEVGKIVKMIAKASTSTNSSARYSDDDPRHVASEIADATTQLVDACHLFNQSTYI